MLRTKIDTSLPSARVTRVLDHIAQWRGYSETIQVDNGPEFMSRNMEKWVEKHSVLIDFIEPGKLAQNVYIGRFNRIYKEEVLDLPISKSARNDSSLLMSGIKNERFTWDSAGVLFPLLFFYTEISFVLDISLIRVSRRRPSFAPSK
ncbi:MAG: hypothetical protein SWO11_18340 [Thermodesulfobacteriota bacterium]|nr:hypothetical protein [Thermodesulfobacteriota bacterium]